MNFAKQAEKKFEIVSTDDPNLVGFKVALNNEFLVPNSIPTLGLAYSSWTYYNATKHSDWANYVYARTEDAENETWFHFIPSLPSSVKITQRIDKIWGTVTVYEYLQNTTSISLPDISSSTTSYSPINTAGYVLNAEEEPIAKGLSRFKIETVASVSVVNAISRFDEDSGGIIEGTETYKLQTFDPGVSAVNSDGRYILSNQVSHNQYKQTTDYVTGLPVGYGNALEWETQDKIYWPPVLVDWAFTNVIDGADAGKFKKILHTAIREGYSNDVNVVRKLWWQQSAYTIPAAEGMIAARIEVQGNLETVSVRETLHGEFVYNEVAYVAPLDTAFVSLDMKVLTWTFGPTNQTDWPATITRVEQVPYKGGFRCLEEVFSRPANYDTSTCELTDRLWTAADGIYF